MTFNATSLVISCACACAPAPLDVLFEWAEPSEDADELEREGESGGRWIEEVGEEEGEGEGPVELEVEDEGGGGRVAAAPRRATFICSGGTCHVAR